MDSDLDLLKIVVFAVAAAVLILRLRSVLGRRTGQERPPNDGYMTRIGSQETKRPPNARGDSPTQSQDNVVSIPGHDPDADAVDAIGADEGEDRQPAVARSELDQKLLLINQADPDFDADEFAGGASAAFEIIINSFANGDRETLRPLLSADVYDNFVTAIAERQTEKLTLDSKLVSVRSCDVIDATMDKRTAFVAVKFISEQINVTHDSDHRIVAGDPNQISTVTDIWTFSRDMKSRNPNWTLVGTDGSN